MGRGVSDKKLCPETTEDGRTCLRALNHKQPHTFAGIEGEACSCMLRWYPNRCTARPEQNQ